MAARRATLSGRISRPTQRARKTETEFPPNTSVKKRYYVHSIHVASCLLDTMAAKRAAYRSQRRTVVDKIIETDFCWSVRTPWTTLHLVQIYK